MAPRLTHLIYRLFFQVVVCYWIHAPDGARYMFMHMYACRTKG